ncbi:MAG: hypothetical protein V1763_00595, partial [Parcubacteria group bacterium]
MKPMRVTTGVYADSWTYAQLMFFLDGYMYLRALANKWRRDRNHKGAFQHIDALLRAGENLLIVRKCADCHEQLVAGVVTGGKRNEFGDCLCAHCQARHPGVLFVPLRFSAMLAVDEEV